MLARIFVLIMLQIAVAPEAYSIMSLREHTSCCCHVDCLIIDCMLSSRT